MKSLARVPAATLLLALSGLAACSAKPAPPPPPAPWNVKVIGLDAPRGGTGGASRCNREGQACADLAIDQSFPAASVVKTTRGARVVLDLGNATRLELGDDSSVGLVDDGGHGLDGLRGTVVVNQAGGAASELKMRVRSQTAEIDAKSPATVVVRAAASTTTITVQKGKLTLRGNGDPLVLVSGETARLVDEKPALRTAAWTATAPRTRGELGIEIPHADPRGLGRMTARVPGTTDVITGVRLVKHDVRVVIRDGFARTEIEEVFQNDTQQVLEGRYVFPLPPDATISRLALWVGDKLVEGEVVEKKRAAAVFNEIVEDTVRPRDPALLEWTAGGDLSLRIFPIPAKSSRKVLLAYNQALAESGGRVRYVYPMSVGRDRATKVDDLSIQVTATDTRARLGDIETPRYPTTVTAAERKLEARFGAKDFAPSEDFVVSYERARDDGPEVSAYVPAWGELKGEGLDGAAKGADGSGYFALRLVADLAPGTPVPAHVRRDRAIVIDTSYSQSKETLQGELELAAGLLREMDADEHFVILACDAGCTTYPEKGLAPVNDASIDAADKWLKARTTGGSSDISGAILDAARKLESNGAGQIVYVGDGTASSGDLTAEAIAKRIEPTLGARKIDLRLLGAGRNVDEVVLGGIARTIGATYERVSAGEALGQRIGEIAMSLRSPVIVAPKLELPPSFVDVYPKTLPNLRLGQSLVVVGKLAKNEPGELKITGRLAGQPYAFAERIQWTEEAARQNPLVPRLWADARIAELQGSSDAAAIKDVIALSKRFHVMSRHTSLLVLENDQMFADFGIKQTGLQSDTKFGDPGAPSLGTLGTLGHGAGTGTGGGEAFGGGPRPSALASGKAAALQDIAEPFGPGTGLGLGRLGGGHAMRSPVIRQGATQVNGRLPPEVIQRIVRQNFGRFRLCYETGLRSNPALRGRVTVKFVIGKDGAVSTATDGGSDLPDKNVVACVVRAIHTLSFPQPEGGIVIVTYPVTFEPPEPEPAADGPTASHAAGDETWTTADEPAVVKLREAVVAAPNSRKKHEALVRGLLSRGRFAESLTAAKRFAELDPDLRVAQDLLAYAAVVNGDASLAVTTIDAQLEADPSNVKAHTRAARAFEAVGDERRACAHWTSLARLRPQADDALYDALRCRARVFEERDAALSEARAIDKPGKLVSELIPLLEASHPPVYEKSLAAAGDFEVVVTCTAEKEKCPLPVVITPSGEVYSPWTPAASRSGAHAVAFGALRAGAYRTIVVGGASGARGEAQIRALGATKKTEITGGATKTLVSTTVHIPDEGGFGWGRLGGLGAFD